MSSTRGPSSGKDEGESKPGYEPESQSDDLYIEISDLHRPAQRGFAPLMESSAGDTRLVPWYRQWVQVPRLVVVAALVATLVVVLLVATPIGSVLSTLSARPTPAPTSAHVVVPTPLPATPSPSPYPTPTLIVPAIGPIPTNCPLGTPPVDFAPDTVIPGVGGSDVWLVAGAFLGALGPHVSATGHRAVVEIGLLSPNNYTLAGWPVQVMVLVKNGSTHTISLTGHDLHTGYSLWWSADANNPGAVEEAAPLALIDTTHPMGYTGDFSIWFGVLYLPGAGCYTIHASWPSGSWTVNFAAGR